MKRYTVLLITGVLLALMLAGTAARPALAADETEPNNTRATADDLPQYEQVYGTINSTSDVDFFKFSGVVNQAVHLVLERDDYAGPYREHLALQDAAGNTLAEIGETEYGTRLDYILPATGVYYVRVTTEGGAGDYILSREREQLADFEPNDTPAQAALIGIDTILNNDWDMAGDVDYYKFNGQMGQRILFGDDANHANDWIVDTRVTLLDAGLNPIEATNSAESDYNDIVTLPATGLYYLKVEILDCEYYGCDEGSYELVLIFPSANEPDSSATATPIAYGEQLDGLLDVGLDVDWFTFTGRAGDVVGVGVWTDDSTMWQWELGLPYAVVLDAGRNQLPISYPYVLPADGVYFIGVGDEASYLYEEVTHGGPYHLSLTRTHSLYVSALKDGLGGNANIKRGDITTRDPDNGQWVLVFDASDVGITQNVNAFEWTSADRLLIALQAGQNVPGLGAVKPTDILRFTPTSLGNNTAGSFSFFMKGADVGLTTVGEKIDAIAWDKPYPTAGARLLVSTTGTGRVSQTYGGVLSFADEDVIMLDQTGPGQPVQGTWRLYFLNPDVSSIPGMAVEDVGAATNPGATYSWDYDEYQTLLVAMPGTWSVEGESQNVKGDAKDVLRLYPNHYPPTAMQVNNLTDKPIDGLSLGPVWNP